MNNGFANRRLRPLGYAARIFVYNKQTAHHFIRQNRNCKEICEKIERLPEQNSGPPLHLSRKANLQVRKMALLSVLDNRSINALLLWLFRL